MEIPHTGKTSFSNLIQRADVVWSRIELKEDEILLIKVSKGLAHQLQEVKRMVDVVFRKHTDNVMIYVEDDLDFAKISKAADKVF